MEEIDINDCIAKVKAYKLYLKEKMQQIANRYTFEDFLEELKMCSTLRFTQWAENNQLEIILDHDNKKIGLRSKVDNDICVMVRCKISMAETALWAMNQVKKEKK